MRIKSHAPLMFVGMTVAGILTSAMIGLFITLMRQDGRDSWFFYAAMTPFLLAGALLAYFGGRRLLRTVRHGSWQLEIPGHSCSLGQTADATLFPSRERILTGELTCRLHCIRINRATTASARITTLWQTTWTLNASRIQPQLGLALSLPFPEASADLFDFNDSGIQWQLNVVIPSQGMSEEPVFDLPVSV